MENSGRCAGKSAKPRSLDLSSGRGARQRSLAGEHPACPLGRRVAGAARSVGGLASSPCSVSAHPSMLVRVVADTKAQHNDLYRLCLEMKMDAGKQCLDICCSEWAPDYSLEMVALAGAQVESDLYGAQSSVGQKKKKQNPSHHLGRGQVPSPYHLHPMFPPNSAHHQPHPSHP